MGWIAAQAAIVEGMVTGMEAEGHVAFVPDKHLMYAAQVLTQELYPRFVERIRSLAGAALVMLPSSARDWDDPEIARISERTPRSPAMAQRERVRFLKLAWDALGPEFGSRQLQYKMFYAGARFVSCGHSWRTYDWDAADAFVDRLGAGAGDVRS